MHDINNKVDIYPTELLNSSPLHHSDNPCDYSIRHNPYLQRNFHCSKTLVQLKLKLLNSNALKSFIWLDAYINFHLNKRKLNRLKYLSLSSNSLHHHNCNEFGSNGHDKFHLLCWIIWWNRNLELYNSTNHPAQHQ